LSETKETTAKEYLAAGKSWAAEGKLTEAIASYEKAIALNPNLLAAYQSLGDTLVDKKDLEAAINWYQKAVEIEPNIWVVWQKLGKCFLEKGKLQEAIATLSKSIELNPNFPWSYCQLGDAFQQIGELDKAINAYSHALRLQPDIWNLYHKLGNIFVKQGKLEAAVAAYGIGLQQKPELDWLHKKLGDALQQLGRLNEAVQSYRKALEINPDICWNYGPLVGAYFGINKAYTEEKIVALTYDDGPQPPYTEKILDILDCHQVKATFFFVGQEIKKHPELVKLTLVRGHQLGNHSYSHVDLICDSAELIKSEIEGGDRLLRELGVTGEIPFRPPWGRRCLLLLDLIFALKKPLIMWDIDGEDYRKKDTPEIIANRVLEMVKPGSIILLHDASFQTVEATSIIIKSLKAKGYCLKTVSEMISGAQWALYG
jgi:peptidoglycan/xylan/chitin deacetylase (PgdA/CDA1 family)